MSRGFFLASAFLNVCEENLAGDNFVFYSLGTVSRLSINRIYFELSTT